MHIREKLLTAGLITGLLMLLMTGGLAFVQQRRLLAMQRLAQTEEQTEKMLNAFIGHLHDVQRRALGFTLLGDETSLEGFRRAAAGVDETGRRLADEPVFADKDRLDALLADVDAYVASCREIIQTAQSQGSRPALSRAGEMIRKRNLDTILNSLRDVEKDNIMAFAERGARISERTRDSALTIEVFVILAGGLILVSAGAILHYYAVSKSLLAETTALNKRLECSRKEIESIVSFVSHDLRAPLINVKGFSDTLSADSCRLTGILDGAAVPAETQSAVRRIVQEDLPESLGFIRSAADTMEQLIATMVRVARAGQLPVAPQRIAVNTIMQSIVLDFEYRIKEAGATVELGRLPDCTADRDQARQVFSNLIDNAIKYRDRSRPLVVHVNGRVEGGYCVYCIEDNGVGIEARDLDRIFEMYHQVNGPAADGQGLGLAIARKMVERNGGSLGVESERHRGSRFFVRLPVAT